MFRTIRLAASLALAIAVVTPALAQDTEQVGLARQMLVAMRSADNFDAVIPTVFAALKPLITNGDAKVAKDWDEIAPLISKEFSTAKAGLLDEIAMIYARNFTKDELRQFAAFYQTPAGQKLAQMTPSLAQQTMVAGQKFGREIATRLGERMREELRKRGNKI